MSQVGNNQDSFGGEFMIQDHDHLSDQGQSRSKGNRRQAEQSQSETHQQGSERSTSRQQGGEKRRQSH